MGRQFVVSHKANCGKQVTVAFPFLPVNPYGYFGRAFEFSRQFLFKWTVNWRFIGEKTFLSQKFSLVLAMTNLSLLTLFFTTRWIRPSGLPVQAFISWIFKQVPFQIQQQTSHRVTPRFILTSILSSFSVGMLCARSLHYQFFAYIAWSTPFLLWRSGMNPLLIYAVWSAQEWAWNVYPSTNSSSVVVVGCLGIQVLGAWWGTRSDYINIGNPTDRENEAHQHTE